MTPLNLCQPAVPRLVFVTAACETHNVVEIFNKQGFGMPTVNLVAGQRLFADFGKVPVVDVPTNVNRPRKPTILDVNCNRNTMQR